MKKKRKRGPRRKSVVENKQRIEYINPINQRLEDINKLKPIVERAKVISQMERVKRMMEVGKEE